MQVVYDSQDPTTENTITKDSVANIASPYTVFCDKADAMSEQTREVTNLSNGRMPLSRQNTISPAKMQHLNIPEISSMEASLL